MHLLDQSKLDEIPYNPHHYSANYEPLLSPRIVGSGPAAAARPAIEMDNPGVVIPIGSRDMTNYRRNAVEKLDESKVIIGEDC
jgi:hypothetical protein